MALFLALILIVVNLQILVRVLFHASLFWAQEFVQFTFVWMIYLGIGVGVRNGLHLRIDLLTRWLSPTSRQHLERFSNLVSLALAGVFIVAGGLLAWLTIEHRSPALGAKVGCVYLVFPLSGLILAVFLIEALVCKSNSQSVDANAQSEK